MVIPVQPVGFKPAFELHTALVVAPTRHGIQAGDAVQPRGKAVRKDLVAHHGHLIFANAKAAAGNSQADRQRLAGQRHPSQAHTVRKGAHAGGGIVGNNRQPHTRGTHSIQPLLHGGIQLLAAIPRQGIIHIQHQGGDTVLAQELRRDGLNGTENIFRGKKHRQTTLL